MRYPDFIELKNTALACRSKKQGRMLTSSFRLWYDTTTNSVKLISRYDDTVFMETFSNSHTKVLIPNTHIASWVTSKVNSMYGVHFNAIQGLEGIKRKYSHFITLDKERYIYTPSGVVIADGKVVSIDDYEEEVLNRTWKNNYAQVSKRNRAALTALHKIVPLPPLPVYDKKQSAYQYTRLINSWDATQKDITRIVDLIMSTPEPTGTDLNTVRRGLGIHSYKVNLRTLLQTLVNRERYDRAKRAGAVTVVKLSNYAR